jgi:uncharacterized RDD family membrane protein YckC
MTRRYLPASSAGLEGHYAGVVTRFVAFVVDVTTIVVLFTVGGAVLEYVLTVLFRERVELSEAPTVSTIVLVLWALLYSAYPLATSGRTFGMAVLGVRAVQVDGRALGTRRAVLRVLVFPLSFLLFGLGFVLILLRQDRRALHDLIARSAVVYAWDARAAHLRFLSRSGGPTDLLAMGSPRRSGEVVEHVVE